jgi:hypothetical protein
VRSSPTPSPQGKTVEAPRATSPLGPHSRTESVGESPRGFEWRPARTGGRLTPAKDAADVGPIDLLDGGDFRAGCVRVQLLSPAERCPGVGAVRCVRMFSHLDFTYDGARDVYICPNGRSLRTSGTVHDGRVRNYLSRPGDCRVCNLKERCTRAPFRKIARDINEEARDHARSLKGISEFEQSSDERKKVEMRFAHLKVHHRFERMRLRGLTGASDEFHLVAIVQNLKTLASHIWRPPLSEPAACV